MINNKKFFGILSIFFAAGINNAMAEIEEPMPNEPIPSYVAAAIPGAAANTPTVDSPAVLFKIHSVTPVANADGQTSSCDFSVTIFNRTEDKLNGASVDLSWEDTTMKLFNDVLDKKMEEVQTRDRRANEAKVAVNTITSSIEIPAIQPMSQTTVNSRVQSDRCFLLMDKVNVKVRSCSLAQSRGATRSANICNGLFKFVSPNDEEYYSEFSASSPADEAAKSAQEKERIKAEVTDDYSKAVAEFDKASAALQSIR